MGQEQGGGEERPVESVYDAIRPPVGPVSLRRLPRQITQGIELVWASARRELLFCTALEGVGAVGVAAQLLIGRSILNAIVSPPAGGRSFGDVVPQIVALAVVGTVSGFAGSALAERRVVLAELVERHVQDRIIAVVTSVDLEAFDRPAFYDRLRRAKVNATERSWQVVFGLVSLMSGLAGSVAVGGVLFSIQPLVLPLVVLACVPLWLATRRNNRATYAFSFGLTPDDRERAYLQNVLTGRPEAKELRLFGLAAFLRQRYDRIYDRRIAELRAVVGQRMRRSLVANAAATAATMVGVAVLVQLTVTGHISTASAAVAAVAVQQIGSRLRSINSSAGQLHECSLFLDDLVSFLDLREAVTKARASLPAPARFTRLVAEGLTFTYAGSNRPAIHDVSLEIGEHEVVALVGRNGSGKTTLAKLLCGLYSPSGGRITWDGTDIATCDPEDVRRAVTAIFQDFVHYELPARDNVALGDTTRFDDLAAIHAACRLVGADGLLAGLPAGYDTRLSRAFDGGTELSVGQWQRIALARAFFRNAPFLILDEPTAALDAEAEADLFGNIRALQQGRSVLLISHRFSSVRAADRIYVLEAGSVIESGAHHELIALGGRYAELFALQASAYIKGHETPADRE